MNKTNTFKADNLKDFKRVIAALKGEGIEINEAKASIELIEQIKG